MTKDEKQYMQDKLTELIMVKHYYQLCLNESDNKHDRVSLANTISQTSQEVSLLHDIMKTLHLDIQIQTAHRYGNENALERFNSLKKLHLNNQIEYQNKI